MYEVTTAIKTLMTTADLSEAMRIAREYAKAYRYIEVKEIVSVNPWITRSVKIFMR